MCVEHQPSIDQFILCVCRISSQIIRAESVETGLSNLTKARLEFGVANAIASTSGVRHTHPVVLANAIATHTQCSVLTAFSQCF